MSFVLEGFGSQASCKKFLGTTPVLSIGIILDQTSITLIKAKMKSARKKG
jgi:hypothetical protein